MQCNPGIAAVTARRPAAAAAQALLPASAREWLLSGDSAEPNEFL
jgi:hypothetical protein